MLRMLKVWLAYPLENLVDFSLQQNRKIFTIYSTTFVSIIRYTYFEYV